MELHWSKRSALVVTGAVVALGIGGAGTAIANNDDDATDTAITGSAYERAKDAALSETGGGKVTGTEVGDEESYYEVEVTLDNGDQVDVQLDKDFRVVGSDADHED